ncbi:MAG: hypothetical protein ACYS1C_12635, partial [Planctomycetota bacterium]
TTWAGSRAPGHEIEQIYYLGAFDPQEQVPPAIYRIRVHGQASLISRTKFASGWVKSELIDSLNTNYSFDEEAGGTGMKLTQGQEGLANLQTGRRLVLFGPEGFREAPRNHRLVIVMGTSPEAYFKAIDKVLGAIDPSGRATGELRDALLKELLRTQREQDRLRRLERSLAVSQ